MMVDKATKDAQRWNNLLAITGGALEIPKCKFHLASYKFAASGAPVFQILSDKLRNLFATALNRIPTIATQNKNLNVDNDESLAQLLDNLRRQCYIHLTYHPLDLPRCYIQQLAGECLLQPNGEPTPTTTSHLVLIV
jgi:hypothetical protein